MKFIVLYGSETGTAQDIAERIWKLGKSIGLSGNVLPMDEYDITKLPYETLAIFVCSTAGQGDQPSNMKKFWAFLLKKNLPLDSLKNLSFAVLGLGDSSYSKFNHAGKKLLRRLEMLGGKVLIPGGWADDQHDLGADAVVDPWIDRLKNSLITNYPELSTLHTSGITTRWDVEVVKESESKLKSFDVDKFHWPLSPLANSVSVHSNIRTTPPQHFQDVRLIKFSSRTKLNYKSGDVAVLRPINSSDNVELLLQTLPQFHSNDIFIVKEKDKDMPVPSFLNKPVTFLQLAINYWDLNAVPRRSVLETLSKLEVKSSPELILEKEKLTELSSSAGQEDYFNYVTRPRRTTVELLNDFPHTSRSIPANYLFDIFQQIRPRMFSIASSPQSEYLEILVAVVKYKTRLVKPREGLCSNWLSSLTNGQHTQLTIKTGSLNFPREGKLLLVGPGTGIAPFRSYICSEEYKKFVSSQSESGDKMTVTQNKNLKVGDTSQNKNSLCPVTLVFGCRNKDADFHFQDDFKDKDGLKSFTAFSRDQPHKIYVQHVILDNSDYFSKLLSSPDVHIMIAGNAKDMPEAVKNSFISSLIKTNTMTSDQATKYIEWLQSKGKYQTETWS